MQTPEEKLDSRDATQMVADLLARRTGYVPQWSPSDHGLDAALVQVAATYWQAIIQRLNQAPGKNQLAFFDTLGIQLIPAQAARTPLVFRLADNVGDSRLPAGTCVAAPPPPERNDQIIFETERATGLAAAKLKEVVSLWPGRDQYIDHSAAFLAGQAFQPFEKKLLENTPHHIYIAHDTLLALAGQSTVNVICELTTPGNEYLDIIWEYWNGTLWRQFKNMQPQCDNEAEQKLDSTDGLRFSGQFVLETNCAETSKTAISGLNAFWIRGRLNEPLPPSSLQILPVLESIKLGTSIARPLHITLTYTGTLVAEGKVRVNDNSGAPLRGIKFGQDSITDFNGKAILADATSPATISATDFEQREALSTTGNGPAVFQLSAEGLKPDKAFSDTGEVDITKPFFPLGPQPQPGAAFYFTNQEIFSKPGARLQVYVQTAATPQDQLSEQPAPRAASPTELIDVAAAARTGPQTQLPHTVSWEYWDGNDWVQLDRHNFEEPQDVSAKDFSGVGLISTLTVPFDMEKTKINGEEGLWMRVRLLSGGYGFRNTLVDLRSGREFAFVVTQPPAVAKFLLGYTWQHGPYFPEHVLAYNDFQYEDRTEEARLPGQTFLPFKPVEDRTPALYLGFDRKLPVDRLGILFDIVEQADDTNGPALLWEYWDGSIWEDLIIDDETSNLRLPGLASLIGPDDSESLARFDAPLYWLRARLKEDGPPSEPLVNGVYLNAVHAIQHQTVVDEQLGVSTGQPNQTFTFTQIPVLEGEVIEVRELAGLRANVEWRSVALEVFGGDARAVRELDAMLALEALTEISKGALRLKRDRNKRVTEVWVHWQSKRHLLFSAPDDRDYVVDRAQGRLLFGDATNGKVPPAGASIVARQYRTGGGSAGNVEAKKISQVLAPIGGIEEAFNPLPAGGGADGESNAEYKTRAPQTLRHRGRALLPEDYEVFAREASPAVAFARAISGRDPSGRKVAGWVTLLIIPRSAEPRPFPSFGLREEVRQHIEAHTSATLAAAHRIYVTGPEYLPVDVDTVLVPLDPAEAGFVEQRTRDALQDFLHPVRGGPERKGWDLGRDVFLSDVAAVLERVDGVDYVKELKLLLNSELQGESARVADNRVVVAGEFRISLVEA